MSQKEFKEYLGDGVYVDIDTLGQIKLTTEIGLIDNPTNTIYLGPKVMDALVRYVKRMENRTYD